MNQETPRSAQLTAFLHAHGWGAAAQRALPGDASSRRYIRLEFEGRRALLMDQLQSAETPAAPPEASPEERRRLGYNALARLAGSDCGRFVAVARFLRGAGLAAPDIYAADLAQGFLLLEDLGPDLYTDVIARGADERILYTAAIHALAVLHAQAAPAELAPGKPLFAYDETALIAETDLLTEWFIPAALGRPATRGESEDHRGLWRQALSRLDHGRSGGAVPVFVHRDYHAQNLIWRAAEVGILRVGVIDFQDAVAGPCAYDLVSLLEDARRDVAKELADAMMMHYLAVRRADGHSLDADAFRSSCAIMAAQRNAKIAGIFARLAKRDAKPRYLAHLPRVWRYMMTDLSHPALSELRSWYDRVIPESARGITSAVA